MKIDFSQLTSMTNNFSIEPRDIFMTLPNKEKSYSYPRDVQTEVWKQWFDMRNEKNLIIKMNTGSGKTVVGLTILQSCLNEGKGPAVYVVPDNYLVKQVCAEAKKLGITTSCDVEDDEGNKVSAGEDNYYFKIGKAILVTNIHKLINGKSVFGLNPTKKIQIGSIIIDDVHACLDVIRQQHTIFIDSSHELYNSIIDVFSTYPEAKDSQRFWDIVENKDPSYNYLVPFWVWQKESQNIYRIISQSKYHNEPFVVFNLPLIKKYWKIINCVISTRGIEFTLKGIPIEQIIEFENAKRRIFMSATLSDDSVFVSTLGLNEDDLKHIITPEKANDIGERLILCPRLLNPQISDDLIKEQLIKKAKKYNVVVIVPSFDRVNFWKDAKPKQILSSKAKNIEEGITKLKNTEPTGLTILVNKYDGIDLPHDACRILVIDGLPAMSNEYDTAIQGMNPNDNRFHREQIQKIEQGMGRGVRSTSDYCVIVFMGDKLINSISTKDNKKYFSPATLKQFELSNNIWEQLMKKEEVPSVSKIFLLSDYVLKRSEDWITASKQYLFSVCYDKLPKVDSFIVSLRKAFEYGCRESYDEAFKILEKEKNNCNNEKTKGLLMQYMAEYKNFLNPIKAQELLASAQKLNSMVLKCKDGIQISKLQVSSDSQASRVIKFIKDKKFTVNEYLIYISSILEDLNFYQSTAGSFEEALKNIMLVLGVGASRPEADYGGVAPDNLLALENLEYAVIECKSRAITEKISKEDCGQLLQSVQWFKNHYLDDNIKYYPIMIHQSYHFDKYASPSPDIRIMTKELLSEFHNAVVSFGSAIFYENTLLSVAEVEKLLIYYNLKGKSFIDNYTRKFIQKK